MRKLSMLLSGFLLLLSPMLFSQQTNFGISAGASLAQTHVSYSGVSLSSDSKIGATAGLFADIKIAEQFSFQPALHYVQKGGKSEEPDINYKSELTSHYVEIPLNVLFKPAMNKIQFFIGAGPYIAAALSAKEKETDNGVETTYKYKFGNDPNEHDMKRMDFGANFITGIETPSGFVVAINYGLGLSNIAPGSSDDGSAKNRYWGFKVGYIFKKK